jgi:hypothetical protein
MHLATLVEKHAHGIDGGLETLVGCIEESVLDS